MPMPFVVLAAAGGLLVSAATGWQRGAPMPTARSEVAAAPYNGGIAIVGGFTGSCVNSRTVDLFLPATNRWRRLPNLPIALNHTAAAAVGNRLYVAGGYGDAPHFSRSAFVYDGVRWKRLRPMPDARAAPGSAVLNGKWYIVGGVTPNGLPDTALVLDLATRKWSTVPGPAPREHLAVTAANGKVYALGGRRGGFDTNLDTFEVFTPTTRRWEQLPPVPEARGGTGVAAVGSALVSIGGEATTGTIGSVYRFDTAAGTWSRLPDLPSARHGMAVAAVGKRVYAIGGNTVPGCGVSSVNEYLDVRR
jgi:non-specific serine/threonine protein kinase